MSPVWQWIFSIIGLVAFLMAFPFVLQLIFGQPHVGYCFSEDDTGLDGRHLKIHLSNPPIYNRLLQALRVSRMTAQDVYLAVTVSSDATERTVDSFMPEIGLSTGSVRVSLPPSTLLSNANIAKWDRPSNSAVLLRVNHQTTLPMGDYWVSIDLGLDGRVLRGKQSGLLHVGSSEQELQWDSRIRDKYFVGFKPRIKSLEVKP